MVLEINDAGLLATAEAVSSGTTVAASPGYALIEDQQMCVGPQAVASARLKPKRIHNRFWNTLSKTALAHPFPPNLSPADLAHRHLDELWQLAGEHASDVILALPGTASEQQLGLTLGIARACRIPVTGMVDAAVAAGSRGDHEGALLHLDLQLHRAVATELTRDGSISRGALRFSDDTGLAGIDHRIARRIAEIFVSTTRLDPLHDAIIEQELYLAVPELLRRLFDEEQVLFGLRAEQPVSVELNRGQLAMAIEPDTTVLLQLARQGLASGKGTLLLSHRVASLPGVQRRLADDLGAETVVLPANAAAIGALKHREAICFPGDALPFVTRIEGHGSP